MSQDRTFVIIGAGAIGAILCARLTWAGYHCIVVGRGPGLDRLAHGQAGIYFDGQIHHIPLDCATELNVLSLTPKDILILAVKAHDVPSLLEYFTSRGWQQTPILCLQNGVDTEPLVASFFPKTFGGVVHLSCTLTAEGNIRQTINRGIGVGAVNRKDRIITEEICHALTSAGIPAWEEDNIIAGKWLKLLINSTGAVMALCDMSIEEAFFYDNIHRKVVATAHESASVLGRLVEVHQGTPTLSAIAETLSQIQSKELIQIPGGDLQARRAAQTLSFPSIWQDLNLRRRQTEVGIINGKILEIAEFVNCSAPINAALVDLITKAERRGLTPHDVVLDPTIMGEVERVFL